MVQLLCFVLFQSQFTHDVLPKLQKSLSTGLVLYVLGGMTDAQITTQSAVVPANILVNSALGLLLTSKPSNLASCFSPH